MSSDFFQQLDGLLRVCFRETGLVSELLVLAEGEDAVCRNAVEDLVEDLRVQSSVENPNVTPKPLAHRVIQIGLFSFGDVEHFSEKASSEASGKRAGRKRLSVHRSGRRLPNHARRSLNDR